MAGLFVEKSYVKYFGGIFAAHLRAMLIIPRNV
jgi:hypothetical protein